MIHFHHVYFPSPSPAHQHCRCYKHHLMPYLISNRYDQNEIAQTLASLADTYIRQLEYIPTHLMIMARVVIMVLLCGNMYYSHCLHLADTVLNTQLSCSVLCFVILIYLYKKITVSNGATVGEYKRKKSVSEGPTRFLIMYTKESNKFRMVELGPRGRREVGFQYNHLMNE